MNINEAFPSNYVRALDLDGNEWTLTITKVCEEQMNDGKVKPVAYFSEIDKGLVLNRTNGMTIASYYSPETDGWIGKQIILYPVKVSMQGQMTDAVRVRAPARQAAPPPRRQASPQAPGPRVPFAQHAAAVGFDDENEDPAPPIQTGRRG